MPDANEDAMPAIALRAWPNGADRIAPAIPIAVDFKGASGTRSSRPAMHSPGGGRVTITT